MLGHATGNGLPLGSRTVLPAAAGLAVTADGKTIGVRVNPCCADCTIPGGTGLEITDLKSDAGSISLAGR
jgi:hypothetical protein